MLTRRAEAGVQAALRHFPVVALIGARQVGKTTLARRLAARRSAARTVMLDLERPTDLARLADAEAYLAPLAGKLVVLDEAQRLPELFPLLRVLVDEHRRPGRFLLLGSATPDLRRQGSESLAGRIVYLELPPLTLEEAGAKHANRLWIRGGYPSSFLARSEAASFAWREAYVETHLERDLPRLGSRVPAAIMRRFWMMLAHNHGQLWNASRIAASLGVTAPTVRHYLDVLAATFMVRELPAYHRNLRKRLVKSPKVYLRDSGVLHALLGLRTLDEVLAHPVCGASWEGWAIEQILARAPSGARASFYRTAAGAEIDLLLERPGRPPVGFEIKRTSAPAPSKGMRAAMEDLGLEEAYLVSPVAERFPLGPRIEALPPAALAQVL